MRLTILSLLLSFTLFFPIFCVFYGSIYYPADSLLDTSIETKYCSIIGIEPHECDDNDSTCIEHCSINIFYLLEGSSIDYYFDRQYPLEACNNYKINEEINCIYKQNTIYLYDIIKCRDNIGLIGMGFISFILFPICFIIIHILYYIIKKLIIKTNKYKTNTDIQLNQITSDNINNTNKISKDLSYIYNSYFGSVLESNLDSSDEFYNIIDIYYWKNSSLQSIKGYIILLVSIISLISWLGLNFILYNNMKEVLWCQTGIWVFEMIKPFLKCIIVVLISWILLFISIVTSYYYYCWFFLNHCYLVALPDKILFFKTNYIRRIIKLENTLLLSSHKALLEESYFSFSSTLSILLLCKWHPYIYLAEGNGSNIKICVFYSQAQQILKWINNTYSISNEEDQ